MAKKELDDDEDVWRLEARCGPVDLMLFVNQLAVLLKCGVQIVPALDSLAVQSESATLARAVRIVQRKVSGGLYLSQGLAYFPRMFRDVHLTMIRIGERTGALVESLKHLSWLLEKDYTIRRKVQGALAYPTLVLSVTLILTALIFATILPGFVKLFDEMHMPLPWITRLVVVLVRGFSNPLVLIFLVSLLAGLVVTVRDKVSPVTLYRWIGRVPLLGEMLRESAVARFCGAMQALLGSGVELCSALELSGQASSHPSFQAAASQAIAAVKQGSSLSDGLDLNRLVYGRNMAQMVRVAEESNQLEAAFGRLAACSNARLEYVIDNLGAALEPLLLGVVSVITGTLVLSIFLPLYGYIANLGG